jgi:hypothetical protein
MNNFYPLDYVTPAIFFSPELTRVLEKKKVCFARITFFYKMERVSSNKVTKLHLTMHNHFNKLYQSLPTIS